MLSSKLNLIGPELTKKEGKKNEMENQIVNKSKKVESRHKVKFKTLQEYIKINQLRIYV